MYVVKDILEGFEAGNHTVNIMCDFSKVFDCLSHNVLLEKLEYYRIEGVVILLIRSYSDSNINNKPCFYQPDMRGVPQGSVLGPLF